VEKIAKSAVTMQAFTSTIIYACLGKKTIN